VLDNLRRRSILVRVELGGAIAGELNAMLERQWDAVRVEPYSNDQGVGVPHQTALLYTVRQGALEGVEPAPRRPKSIVPVTAYDSEKRLAMIAYWGDVLARPRDNCRLLPSTGERPGPGAVRAA
jgi:hypothetical protein